MKENKIELRSEEVQDILGTPPRWIVRWGITVMIFVLAVLIAGSYFYKYPDIITSRITILSENPPAHIVARSSGKIDNLFVHNNQTVKSGELLAVIDNTANHYDAYRLLNKLDSVFGIFQDPSGFVDVSFTEEYSLGQYQSYFSSFENQLTTYQTFLFFNPNDQRIESLQKQVDDYEDFFQKSNEQISILKQDYDLAESLFARDSLLFARQIMSKAQFEKSKASMLKQKFNYQNAVTDLANTRIVMNNLLQLIEEQKVLKAETENQLLADLKEKYDNLVNQLKEWEQTFILKSPISGEVTFNNFWSINQYVTSGSVVFTVVPDRNQKLIGRAEVPVRGAGKIEPGQKVNIKLDNFPHMEYGIVEGRVRNISQVPLVSENGAYYTIEVELVNKLVTNYDRELPFNQEMQGSGEIITKDRRMIERIIEPLVSKARERM
jgi:multidrug resistance efflux pump